MDSQLLQNISYYANYLWTFLEPIILLIAPRKILSSYMLHKDFKPKNITKVSIPVELKQKYSSVDLNAFGHGRIREVVKDFVDVMEREFPKEALANFYNNINEAKIKRNAGVMLIESSGVYLCKKNKINVSAISSLYHELFHLASSSYDPEAKLARAGFSQVYHTLTSPFEGVNMGIGLNEGYTELLTQRYFDGKCKPNKYYRFEVNVASNVEKIVGEEEMKKLYLKSDLRGLIENLKQYASEEEVMQFVNSVDLVSRHSTDIFLFRNSKMKASITNVYTFLMKAYLTKLKRQLEEGAITINEFVDQATEYIKALKTKVKFFGHTYNYMTVESLLDVTKEIVKIQEEYPKNIATSGIYKK
ncbi:MAG: hypothetical protein IKO78_00335 [Bacilli bacterium]|nr:hypothetical protein [Bacilli bacterium]